MLETILNLLVSSIFLIVLVIVVGFFLGIGIMLADEFGLWLRSR